MLQRIEYVWYWNEGKSRVYSSLVSVSYLLSNTNHNSRRSCGTKCELTIYYLLKFSFINCHYFETLQANHMMRFLKIISKRSSKSLESKTLTLMELIKCCPLKFYCYLFDLDLKQACSLLEASSTYIVFLIQYDIAMGFNMLQKFN